jgi:hypothetical protein
MERRRDENHSLQKINSIQDLVGNEKNGYPVLDYNTATIKVTKKHSDVYKKKKTLKEEISEKFMEKIQDMVIQNIQDTLKKFENTQNKEHEKTWK